MVVKVYFWGISDGSVFGFIGHSVKIGDDENLFSLMKVRQLLTGLFLISFVFLSQHGIFGIFAVSEEAISGDITLTITILGDFMVAYSVYLLPSTCMASMCLVFLIFEDY